MKKYILAIAAGLVMTGLVGCGTGNAQTVEPEVEAEVIEDKTDDNQPVVIEGGKAPEASEAANPNYLSLQDAGIVASNVSLFVGDDFKPVVDTIGEAEIVEGQACLDDGFDTNYYYGGEDLIVYTYAQDGKQIIYDIYAESDAYVTLKGVKVGSTREDVEKIYGEPNETAGASYKYYVENEKTVLSFDFNSDDTVKAIDLLRAN